MQVDFLLHAFDIQFVHNFDSYDYLVFHAGLKFNIRQDLISLVELSSFKTGEKTFIGISSFQSTHDVWWCWSSWACSYVWSDIASWWRAVCAHEYSWLCKQGYESSKPEAYNGPGTSSVTLPDKYSDKRFIRLPDKPIITDEQW